MSEKQAQCLLLWVHQGGEVVNGRPFRPPGNRASGLCDVPYDCFGCPLMQTEIAKHPVGQANWVCPSCIREVAKRAKQNGITLHLAGHYTEGQCQYAGCTRPPRTELREVILGIEEPDIVEWPEEELIERPRGYSILLQLVIGNINS